MPPIGVPSVPDPQPLSEDELECAKPEWRPRRRDDRGQSRSESERRGRRQKSDEVPCGAHEASEPYDQKHEQERPDEEHRHQAQSEDAARGEEDFWWRGHRARNPEQEWNLERRR